MSLSAAQKLALLPAPLRRAWLAGQNRETLEEVAKGAWWWVGRPEQFRPPGDWLIWLIRSGRGWGKALDVDTPVPTPGGWTTMGQLKDGDQVFTAAGHVTTVTHAHPIRYDRPCYRLTFSDGCTIVADADHQWTARSRADRRAGRAYRTVTTRQMLDTGLTVAGESNWQMPAAYPLEMPDADLPIDPYVLGFWLGDGASAGSDLTIGSPEDAEIVGAQFATAGYPIRHRSALQYGQIRGEERRDDSGRWAPNGSLHSVLRGLDLIGNKHIPAAYLRAATTQRVRLLEGLIDSDGYVEHATGRIEITTIREDLADQIAELARTLGHRARIYAGRATLNGADCGPKYRVVWVARSGGGRLPRKTLADRSGLGQPNRLITRYVTAIEPVESRPVRCISVADPSQLYLAGRDFLVTHNTRTGAEDLLDRVFRHPVDAFGQRTEWLVVAETLNDCRTACIEGNSGILAVLHRMGMVKGRDFQYRKSPKLMIEFTSGQIIYFEGADNADVGRGFNAAGAWLDELAKWRYTYDAWYEGLLPSLRAPLVGDHPRAVVTTTPKPIKLLIEWQHETDGTVVITTGSIFDNVMNLSAKIVSALKRKYEGTRAGLQELYGHLLEEIEGALWNRTMIENNRVKLADVPEYATVVISMDPGATGAGDETGLIAAARGYDGDDYVLADWTMKIVGHAAARRAWEMFRAYGATWLIIETNMGKKWLMQVVTDAYAEMQKEGLFEPGPPPVKEVTSLAGKKLRAEPVASRYEQNRWHHVGTFVELEDQMCLVGGTLIETDRGQVPIEKVTTADLVMTREGWAPLRWAGQTGVSKELVTVTHVHGCVVSTPCHPFFLPSTGQFVNARNVPPAASLLASPNWASTGRPSPGVAGGITGCRSATTGTPREPSCIEPCGSSTVAPSLPECSCITSTNAPETTGSATSPCSPPPSIASFTRRSTARNAASSTHETLLTGGPDMGDGSMPAPSAESPFTPGTCAPSGVVVPVTSLGVAASNVPVFNLTVADGYPPEFFANGVLVHNCTWVPEDAGSPDRIDALVQAGLFLMGKEHKLVRIAAPSADTFMPSSSPYG